MEQLRSGVTESRNPVRLADSGDRVAIGAMLARAFADDPATSFIFPDAEERAKRLPRLFALLFDEDARGMRVMTQGGEAAALWRGPGQNHTSILDMLLQAWPMWRIFGGALGRALAVSNAIDAHFPAGDYWYLHIAGCDPAAQGRGLGGAVIRSALDRVADSGLPAYLETATPRNLSFYRGLGFEVTAEWTVPKGGPLFWSMMRAAR
ncbi:MAG: GNAT family N-acetyltransferase [Pseudomonadota bacterium]|jgi:GNAT superfamily N-acetyltransferase|uniref:Putative acetyltransferase n=1 Tax=hydrothermal vent metagenome TaxID=652676 RepID=A0A170PPL4_9ZZZZ